MCCQGLGLVGCWWGRETWVVREVVEGGHGLVVIIRCDLLGDGGSWSGCKVPTGHCGSSWGVKEVMSCWS